MEPETDHKLREEFENIVNVSKNNPRKAVLQFQNILTSAFPVNGEGSITRFHELSIYHLAALYAELGETDELLKLLSSVRPLFESFPKPKTAKIVRVVIDSIAKIPGTEDQQLALCKEYIDWATVQKRAFLRQRIQTRLANLYLSTGKFQSALRLLASLQNEVKKLHDKQLLVEIFLLESRVHHALFNVPRARASLTSARSVSNSIYVGPLVQGEIDLQNGVLNTDEKDYRTAYSYFFEAFESLNSLGDARAIQCLKYMLLSKIMFDQGDEVPSILNMKAALTYSSQEIYSMREVAKAYKERSLHAFDKVMIDFSPQLVDDKLVARHLKSLQARLLEQNLIRIIEPYSRVEIEHVATLINLPIPTVETKLSQMILDNKIQGVLDQGTGELVVFDDPISDTTYEASLEVLEDMSNVVESLSRRTEELQT